MADDVLAPGTDLFGYTIERTLGRGGMGTVYLARQRSLERTVALKVLHPSRTRNPQVTSDFFNEARAAARLRHAHLVGVHDFCADPARSLYAYSMEYVDGRTGSALVGHQGPLAREQALGIAAQVASALSLAHANGLVHRDVKPENVLIDATGTAKLLDLGLAYNRLAGLTGGGSGARRLSIVGTPDFSAPEQLRNPDRASPASDVFSLGLTLYTLLAGKLPFEGETIIDLIIKVATEDLVFPTSMDPACRELLTALTAKDPGERPGDGAAAQKVIESVLQGRRPGSFGPPRRPLTRRFKYHR